MKNALTVAIVLAALIGAAYFAGAGEDAGRTQAGDPAPRFPEERSSVADVVSQEAVRRNVPAAWNLVLVDDRGRTAAPPEGARLFFRPAGSSHEDAARSVSVLGGRPSLGEEVSALAPVALIADGRPYRPDEAHTSGKQLAFVPFDGALIEVRDPSGAPAADLEVRYQERSRAWNLHPGSPSRRLRHALGSPLLIPSADWSGPERTLYVRGARSRWTILERDGASPCTAVDLLVGGDLVVDCGSVGVARECSLAIRGDAGRTELVALGAGRTLLRGLPPGAFEVTLNHRGKRFTVEADIPSGGTAVAAFELDPGVPLALGTLHGTVSLAGLDPALVDELAGRLRLVLLHETALDGVALTGTAHHTPELVLVEDRGDLSAWSWRASDLAGGGYRVVLEPIGAQAEVWLDPAGDTLADLSVDRLAEVEVSFRDVTCGSVVAPRVTNAIRLVSSFGDVASTRLRHEPVVAPEPHVRLFSVPGRIALDVRDDTYGQFTVVREVQPGRNELEIEVEPARWLEFVVEGPGGPLAPTHAWWDGLELSRAALPLEPLGRAYPLRRETPALPNRAWSLRLSVPGTGPVTARFPEDRELGALDPIDIPPRAHDAPVRQIVTVRVARERRPGLGK